ncbi:hypothetical protein [Allofranklinella schreckenbergeri]|nr:hypothetical protein [Allofranklinella schreckenbergeri]
MKKPPVSAGWLAALVFSNQWKFGLFCMLSKWRCFISFDLFFWG